MSEPNVITVEAAARLVSSWSELSGQRQRDLRSALHKVAEQKGLPANACALTPANVITGIKARSPVALGVEAATKSNILSGIAYVMRRLDLIDAEDTPISATWAASLAQVTEYDRAGLTRFARHCSERQIAPKDVTVDVIWAFHAFLQTRTLTPKPRKRAGEVRSAWNRAAGTLKDWPTGPLPLLSDPRQHILPLEAFPEPFQADLEKFGAYLTGTDAAGDPFGDNDENPLPQNPRPSRPVTAALRKDHARWAASALIATGTAIETVTSLAILVEPGTPKKTLRFLYEFAGGKPSAHAMHVAEVLRIIARHYTHAPEPVIKEIQRYAKAVKVSYSGMTEKNQRTMREALTPSRDLALLELPDQYMAEARKCLADQPKYAAGLAWRALAIAFLSTIPLRDANIRKLRLDTHLHRPDPVRARIEAVMIPTPEAKGKRPLQMPVSQELGRLLEEWITRFRPILAAPHCLWLFPGQGIRDEPLSAPSFREALKKATSEFAGVTLTTHQLRHLAAHRYLDAFPGQYEAVRQLLGHSSVETTLRHYAGHQTDAHARVFDALIDKRRKSLRHKSGATPSGKRITRGGR